MPDLRLVTQFGADGFGDLDIVDGDLVINDGVQAILQAILQNCRTFLGEWFLDNQVGLPFFQQILVKNPDQAKIDAIFQNAIMGTPGVLQLMTYSFRVDVATRQLFLSFQARVTDGVVDYSGLLDAAA